jgi:hypothetical protein
MHVPMTLVMKTQPVGAKCRLPALCACRGVEGEGLLAGFRNKKKPQEFHMEIQAVHGLGAYSEVLPLLCRSKFCPDFSPYSDSEETNHPTT